MSAGRCGACGYVNQSCKTVRSHMLSCPDAAEAYAKGVELLDPTDEYKRFKLENPEIVKKPKTPKQVAHTKSIKEVTRAKALEIRDNEG